MISRRSAFAAATLVAGAATLATRATGAAETKPHRVALHVDDNDAARMNLALNNATNVIEYYAQRGQTVEIEIVTYGPGLHMLRADTSPIKDLLRAFMAKQKQVAFAACQNTMNGMQRAEGKEIPIVEGAKVVPAGVIRLIELQEEGWAYVKP